MFQPRKTIVNCTPSRTRYRKLGVPFDRGREEKFFITWTSSAMPMNLRSFIFEFLNNMLKLNSNMAKILNDPSKAPCTFCTIERLFPPPSEKPPHLFAFCPISSPLIEAHMATFFGHPSPWEPEWQILGAPDRFTMDQAYIINIEILTANYYIYNCRKEKKAPNAPDLQYHMNYYISIFSFTRRYRNLLEAWKGRRFLN